MCQNSQPRNLFPDILEDTMDHRATVTFNGTAIFFQFIDFALKNSPISVIRCCNDPVFPQGSIKVHLI